MLCCAAIAAIKRSSSGFTSCRLTSGTGWDTRASPPTGLLPGSLDEARSGRAGGVLSQCRVDQKTNEHKAALDLLKSMVLEGQVIVGDAMFCQRDLCEQIVEDGGDYFFPVKEKQPTLLREIQLELAANEAAPFSRYTGPLRTTPA
ncbi:MAG: transposase [Planctomycetaceae bacterium]